MNHIQGYRRPKSARKVPNPKSLENIAVKKGLVTIPLEIWGNELIQKLRAVLISKGNRFCGGGFLEIERLFSSNDNGTRQVSKETFRRIVLHFLNTASTSNLDSIFDLLSTAESSIEKKCIDFEFFLRCLRVRDHPSFYLCSKSTPV